ncbi:beta-ketoacyl synthase N-terminal-like domain-containing protein [Actinomyces slackii]|uniref:3-oxoacyl-(Acyl carrier protein) synthase II n=1 Tax=Actinomyces slackii TaxID=52774 RepID=A0A448KFX0_9ACTO|nr:3-oxoacyl-(acyl carrier protein) synthase II [Actinomyces slackii]
MSLSSSEPLYVWNSSVVSRLECSLSSLRKLDSSGLRSAKQHTLFDAHGELNERSIRNLDRSSALLLSSVKRLGSDWKTGVVPKDQLGVIVGTSFGSISSTVNFTQDSFTESRPYLVNPAKFPNTVMNFAAAQAAIWNGLKGPNATIAGGAGSLFVAATYGQRLMRSGQASGLVVGVSEESSPERDTIESAAREQHTEIIEGAASFLVTHKPNVFDQSRPQAELRLWRPVQAARLSDLQYSVERWFRDISLSQTSVGEPAVVTAVGESELCDAVLGHVGVEFGSKRTVKLGWEGCSLGAWGGGLALSLALDNLAADEPWLIITTDELHQTVTAALVSPA